MNKEMDTDQLQGKDDWVLNFPPKIGFKNHKVEIFIGFVLNHFWVDENEYPGFVNKNMTQL